MDWFLYDNGLHHERVNAVAVSHSGRGSNWTFMKRLYDDLIDMCKSNDF